MMKKTILAVATACVCSSWACADEPVTYCRDVAPIMFKHCAPCHRPGEVAPFSLLTYRDAAKRARHLKEVTASGRMPPWHAEEGELKFLDERRLSKKELAVLARWAETGAKQGDPKDLPPTPKFTDGWQLGKPDVILEMPKVFNVPADGPDIWYTIIFPIPSERAKYLRGFEFRPGNRRVVHHSDIYLNPTGEALEWAKKHGAVTFTWDKGAGLESSGVTDPLAFLRRGVSNLLTDKQKESFPRLGQWSPGQTARYLPAGLGVETPPTSALVMVIHYHPDGKVEPDQTRIGLHFTDTPKNKEVDTFILRVMPIGNNYMLNIPAGAKEHTVKLSRQTVRDSVLHRIYAHGHFIFRRATVTAKLPDGKELTLVKIKDWDLNWQDTYDYAEPVRLPAGTRVNVVGIFDNSEGNPQNPNKPPIEVRSGPRSTDEMFGILLYTVPEGPIVQKLLPQALKGDRLRALIPPEGIPVPRGGQGLLRQQYDKNGDGMFSAEEIADMLSWIRAQVVLKFVRSRMPFVGNSGVGPDLLLNKSVQTELKLNSEQVRLLNKLCTHIVAKYKKEVDSLNELEALDSIQKGLKVRKALVSEWRAKASSFLNKQQIDRFRQIQTQSRGLYAFLDPEMAKKLKLTKGQEAELRKMVSEFLKLKNAAQNTLAEKAAAPGAPKVDGSAVRKEFAPIRKEYIAKATAVLSLEQQQTWDGLVGRPFEIQEEAQPPNPRAPAGSLEDWDWWEAVPQPTRRDRPASKKEP
jgi:hypothetical protein